MARVKKDRAESKGKTDEIREKTIEKVTTTGYVIDGAEIPATGITPGLQAGQRVNVAYRNGRPLVIFSHNARRAKFTLGSQIVGSVIEELFTATVNGLTELFFRN